MRTITIEIPDDLAHALRTPDRDIARDARLALAILWYNRGVISQDKAAELAGLGAGGFSDELGRANVSAIQTSVNGLRKETKPARRASRGGRASGRNRRPIARTSAAFGIILFISSCSGWANRL